MKDVLQLSSAPKKDQEFNWSAMSVQTKVLFLVVPLTFLVMPFCLGAISLWQLPVWYAGVLGVIWGGGNASQWLFARNLTSKERLIRRLPYSILMATWVVVSTHSTFGFVGSIPIALVAIPGMFLILFDAPTRHAGMKSQHDPD